VANNISSLADPNEDAPIHIVWRNVIIFGYFHLAGLYGLYLVLANKVMWQSIVFSMFLVWFTVTSITVGVHRLWSHRSFKATLPLRLFLAIANCCAYQNSIYEWSRDHRVHHKYSETNADPHNAKRGFFFSHVGWLLSKKHPDVKAKGKGIDCSDLLNDPVVRIQNQIYYPAMVFCCFVAPMAIPHYFWGESLWVALNVCVMLRYVYVLNCTWLVNSAAHMFGNKPYDKNINPAENRAVALLAMGEGWHNYHHTFPWDYKTAELGNVVYNCSTSFLNICSKLGLAYDLKSVNEEVIRKRCLRTGDGSHPEHAVWGWGDKEMTKEDHEAVEHITSTKKAL
jgi:stearoyl-CoA desaturase (delta-9 desaturase)